MHYLYFPVFKGHSHRALHLFYSYFTLSLGVNAALLPFCKECIFVWRHYHGQILFKFQEERDNFIWHNGVWALTKFDCFKAFNFLPHLVFLNLIRFTGNFFCLYKFFQAQCSNLGSVCNSWGHWLLVPTGSENWRNG